MKSFFPYLTRLAAAALLLTVLVTAGCGGSGEVPKSGTAYKITFDASTIPDAERISAMNRLRTVLRTRLQAIGFDTFSIDAVAPGTLELKLPAVYMAEQGIALSGLKGMLSKSGDLRFCIVRADNAELLEANAEAPEGSRRIDFAGAPEGAAKAIYIEEPPAPLRAEHLISAEAYKKDDGFLVALVFNPEGTTQLENFTTANQGRQLAILLDDQILMNATLSQPITGGKASITGASITEQYASFLTILLNSGTLPLPITVSDPQPYGDQPGAKK